MQQAVELDLRGRLAIVTGAGRRQGIGAAICRALASHGANLFFTYWQPYDEQDRVCLDPDGPAALIAELKQFGVAAAAAAFDLADPGVIPQVFAAVAALGQPMILVNNAAYSTRDGYQQLDAATLDAHYAVNLRVLALLSVEFARRYSGEPGGRIINLTSGQSLGPMPEELAYIATKGAVEAFTRTLAVEVASKEITVNAVDPGPTDTGWMPPAFKAELQATMAFGRIGQPADVARLVTFLASDAAAWITGQVLHSRGA